jgi:hypothetical protein
MVMGDDRRMIAHCHIQIREIAKAAAGELYERLMGEQHYYDAWKKQNPDCTAKQLEDRFIEKNWPKCIPYARATLALLLRRPDVPDSLKLQIMDVLEKDQSLIRGRRDVRGTYPTVV